MGSWHLHSRLFVFAKSIKINCAKNAETPFLFTGPRHGFYTGFSKLQNGLEIFTAALNEIKVDPEANTMVVGGAAIFKDVANALYAVKKNIRESGHAQWKYSMDASFLSYAVG